MPSIFLRFAGDSAGNTVAAEAGLSYRPVSELKGMLARSHSVQIFAWGFGAWAVALAVLSVMGHMGNAGTTSFPAGGTGCALLALAGLLTGMRKSLGRYLCVGISTVLIAQVAWYISSPSHWIWNPASTVIAIRFVIGWMGLVTFVGTHELFGTNRIGHAVLKEAVEAATDAQVQESSVLHMQPEAPPAKPSNKRDSEVA